MDAEKVWQEAKVAAIGAAKAVTPVPMTVCEADIFGKPLPGARQYYVSEGMCGFAWVKIRPARGPLVTHLKKIGAGHSGYEGGYDVWIGHEIDGGTQSIDRKECAARAMADVFRRHGVNAYAHSRLD